MTKDLTTIIEEWLGNITGELIEKEADEMSDEYIYKLAMLQDIKSKIPQLVEEIEKELRDNFETHKGTGIPVIVKKGLGSGSICDLDSIISHLTGKNI